MSNFYSWAEYYHGRDANISNLLLHWQYIFRILLLHPAKLLEVGCGPAEHSLFIKKILPSIKLSLLDQDKKLLESVVKKNTGLIDNYYISDVTSKLALAKIKLPRTNLIISQGLMEHFSDRKFISVINNLSSYTQRYLFSIPSNLYPNRDYGNEILRSAREVETLLSTIPGIRYKVIKYFDIGFRTKLLAKKIKHLSGWNYVKYFFGSFHLLIEIEYL